MQWRMTKEEGLVEPSEAEKALARESVKTDVLADASRVIEDGKKYLIEYNPIEIDYDGIDFKAELKVDKVEVLECHSCGGKFVADETYVAHGLRCPYCASWI